jgi:hypothetical protein
MAYGQQAGYESFEDSVPAYVTATRPGHIVLEGKQQMQHKTMIGPSLTVFLWRSSMRDYSPLALLRGIPEDEIMRGQDGVSDFVADLFPVKSDSGRYYCLGNGRGTGGPNCSTQAMLAPGPEGPVATERFEMLREGTELGKDIQISRHFTQVPVEMAGPAASQPARIQGRRHVATVRATCAAEWSASQDAEKLPCRIRTTKQIAVLGGLSDAVFDTRHAARDGAHPSLRLDGRHNLFEEAVEFGLGNHRSLF